MYVTDTETSWWDKQSLCSADIFDFPPNVDSQSNCAKHIRLRFQSQPETCNYFQLPAKKKKEKKRPTVCIYWNALWSFVALTEWETIKELFGSTWSQTDKNGQAFQHGRGLSVWPVRRSENLPENFPPGLPGFHYLGTKIQKFCCCTHFTFVKY